MEKNILDERAASRFAQISNQPVTPSEQDVVRILLAQQQVSMAEIKMKHNAWPSELYCSLEKPRE